MIFDRNVRAECGKRDSSGREVCKVLDGSRDVGLEQIQAGLAWWYRAYAKEQSPADRQRYERTEDEARAKKVGLGRDPNPVPPWEWRHSRHQTTCSSASLTIRGGQTVVNVRNPMISLRDSLSAQDLLGI